MLSNRQIDRIAKTLYPSSEFSHRERKHLRQAVREEMEEYLDKNPDATYEDVQQYYENRETMAEQQGTSNFRATKIIILVGLLIAILCAVLFSISNSWTPPTYKI